MRTLVFCGLIGTGLGCTSPGPLVDHTAWEVLDVEDDPLADHRPDDAACPVTGYGVEDDALEIRTGVCSYFAATQPSLKRLRKDDPLRVVLWHSTLDAGAPAEGHVALLFGEEILWEHTALIPDRPRVYEVELAAPVPLEIGDSVALHLHNHGDNAWTFLTLEVPET